ncbi:MAG: hypothetical protein R3B72_30885 [Polyangiaceae bacterium]
MRSKLPLLVLLPALVLVTPVAHADENEAAAQLLYEEAKGDIDDGHYEQACPKLEKSLAIDEAMGARFLLAECYEKTGRLASAWNNYVKVQEQAHREGLADREEYAMKRAQAVRDRVPTVTLVLDPATRALDLEVSRNGEVVSAAVVDAPIPLDPGEHHFEVRAPGHQPFEASITVAEQGHQELAIPALVALPGDTDNPAPATDDGGLGPMFIAGLVVGGVGLAGMGIGIGVGVAAKGSYDSAIDEHCTPQGCTPAGVSATEDARSTGTIGTALFGIGAGLTAVGLTLVILDLALDDSPDGADVAVHVAPGPGGGLVQLQGRF